MSAHGHRPELALTGGAASASPPLTLRFDSYELDFARHELRREGALVALQPTPLRVLLYLAERRDRTVPRRELLDAIWPGVVVGDEALTTALAEARHAVGDDGAAQRVIRTLKGAGYRFVAEVVVAVEPADTDSPREPASPPRLGVRRRSWLTAGAAALLVGAAVAAAFFRTPPPAQLDADLAPFAFAVLPIQSLSANPTDRELAAGLSDQITHALTAKGYAVVASTTARQWKAGVADVRALGRELHVSYVIEGSVQRERGRVRASLQVVSTQTGKQMWSDVVEESDDDRFALQDRVSARVVRAVRWCADPTVEQMRRTPELASLADSYHEMYRWGAEGRFEEVVALARKLLDDWPSGEALRIQRGILHTHLAIQLWWIHHSGERALEGTASQMLAEARAGVADVSGPGTQHVLMLAQLANWQWEEAEQAAQASCQAPGDQPTAAVAVCGISRHWLCAAFGCAEEQLPGARMWRGPAAWHEDGGVLTLAFLNNDMPADAERAGLRAAVASPVDAPLLGSAQWRLGKRAEAVASIASWWEARGADGFARDVRRIGAEASEVAWRWQADQLAAGSAPFTSTANDFFAARLYAELGDYEAALAALERSVHEREPGMHMQGLDVVFDPIRDTPRFRALIEKMDLTAYQAKYLKRTRVVQPVAPPVANDPARTALRNASSAP
jgi:TolB-like protein/DNA-binding winged helix-turn-helix (wHTH) protein